MDESDYALLTRLKKYAEETSGLDARLKEALLRLSSCSEAALLDVSAFRTVICDGAKEGLVASPETNP